MQKTSYKYIVLGAGISGITIANELQNAGKAPLVLEANDHPGGVLQSVRKEKFYWDRSAHTIAIDEELMAFFERYELVQLLQLPSLAAKLRQLCIGDKIHNLYPHPAKILSAKFLSSGAKFKIFKELFKKPYPGDNPTVSEFFCYHFGPEITKNIVSAVFAGIYSGDIDLMEMKSVMRNVYELEQTHGSIIRGLKKLPNSKRTIYGVKDGIEQISVSLSKKIKHLQYNSRVIGIHKSRQGFIIECNKGSYTAEHIISTLPAYDLSKIVAPISSAFSEKLAEVSYAPMVLVHVAFKKRGKHEHLEAFGFLCNQYEYPHLKGVIYNSALFPDRAPEQYDSYTIFMKPNLEWLESEEKLSSEVEKVIDKFRVLTKIEDSPHIVTMSVWKYGIPQFNKPYSSKKASLLLSAEEIGGFSLSGSYISGVSIPDCIKYNIQLAAQLISEE